ncbi:MAG: hypothetical protein WDM86_14635 [Rhizomicrobium sp.]
MSMTYRPQTPHRPPDPNNDVGILVVFGGLGAVVLAFTALASSVAAAMYAGVYIVLAGGLLFGLRKERRGSFRTAFFVLLASGAAAAISPLLVFDWKLFTWTVAEIAVAALYAASLVLGLFAALKPFWRWLAVALALALVAIVVYAPAPKGGEAADEGFSVAVSVHDEEGRPLPGALVTCAIAFAWSDGVAIDFDHAHVTDLLGHVDPWEFHEDRRLKAVICGATKPAGSGTAGFPTAMATVAPILKGENEVEIDLHENPHPDTAYLDIELAHPPQVNWFYLNYELWPGPPGDIPFGGSAESGQRPIVSARYADDFAIPAADASSDLYLRYRFEGPSGAVSQTVHVGPLEAGRRRVLTLDVPWQAQPR